MPELVIPLINEVFGTEYPEDIPIIQKRNEHETKSGEIITDSHLFIGNRVYHIECQSTGDPTMVIRMIEYDFATALEYAQRENGKVRIYFPHSCVLYLRGKYGADVLEMEIVMPDGRTMEYHVPIIRMEQYTRDVIFRKKLLFLFPVTKREWCLSGDSEKIGRKYCTNFELMVKFCYYVRKIKNNGAIL